MRVRPWSSMLLIALLLALAAGCGGGPKAPSLSEERPGTLTVATIGRSVEGRPIEALSLGNGPLSVLVIGGLHTGAENATATVAEQLARHFGGHLNELPAAVRIIFIPLANPDGYADETRVNANGVDLNRNWPTADWAPEAVHGEVPVSGGPAPLSEPETRALYAFIDDIEPEVVVSFHGYGAIVEPNDSGRAKNYAAAFSKAAKYDLIDSWTYYEITGEFIEAMNDLDVAAFDVELGDGEKNRFGKQLSGLRAVLKVIAEATDQ
ncbi:MAG: M14 family zinc carboxypeptidase [Dehalococcoidia bacterium]